MRRLGIRRRLLLLVVAAVAVAVSALVTAFNVVLARTLDHDARDVARSRAVAVAAAVRFEHGRIVAADAPDGRAADAYVWLFAGRRTVERPYAAPAVARAARTLAGSAARFADVSSTDTRLYATPVSVGMRRVGTAVAGVSLAPYEQTRATALASSLVFGALVLLVVAAAARWLLASSLRPVVRMTRQAADWSEHDPEHRFALGTPHDELTELGATLDELLARLAASLGHERRFSAELSHELRTPLARALAECEVALRRERTPTEYRAALELVHRNAAQLARIVDALVAAARHGAGNGGVSDAVRAAAGAAAACDGLASERGIDLDVAPPPGRVRVGVDGDLAERILQPVIENACRYGRSRVRVAIARESSTVAYTIDDDGPGVGTDERDRIFDPGFRGAAGAATGAGLGLALARRLARSVSGDVAAEPSPGGGRFVVRLPAV